MKLIPFIKEQDRKKEGAFDIYYRILKDNIMFISTKINIKNRIQSKN